MEQADEILANMGISDAVPLSESTTESITAVGKNYDSEELPQIDDSQRLALLEGCGAISEAVTGVGSIGVNLAGPQEEKPKKKKLNKKKVEEHSVIQGAPTGEDGRNFDNAWKVSDKDLKFFSGVNKKLKEDWRQDDPNADWNEEDDDEYDEDKDKIEEKSPAWQRKEGKSKSGGLNRKGVASYRAANPGSKLQTAVTTEPSKLKKGSKAAKRRKSFCARMSGMKKRRTSAKTARDPNSRINKSLRKWNCNEGWRPVAESVTTVGNIGVNMAGGQPKPKKKKKNKLDKATNKFLTNKLNTLK